MKNTVKMVALLLVMLSLLSMMAACGKKKDSEAEVAITVAQEVFQEETAVTMQDIWDAAQNTRILSRHNSYVRTESYIGSDVVYEYFEKEITLRSVTGGDGKVYQNNEMRYLRDESGTYFGSFYIGREPERHIAGGNAFFGEEILQEQIVSVRKQDGKLYVETILTGDAAKAVLESRGIETFDGDFLKTEYELEESSLQPLGIKKTITAADGQEDLMCTVRAEYDTAISEEAKPLYDLAAQKEELRTITIISAPGTAEETRWTGKFVKGLTVQTLFDEAYAGSGLYTDSACTKPLMDTTDKNQDLLLYVQ